MAISRVGFSSTEATTITLPGSPQAGDLMIIFAFRDGSTTNPTIPTGWTNLTNTADGTTCSSSIGWRRYVSGDTSGTWTNATGLICAIYRGVATHKTPLGGLAAPTSSAGTTNTVSYVSVQTRQKNNWLVAFAAHRSIDTTIETAPANLTNQTNTVGATAEYAGHDSNGIYSAGQGTWPATNVSITGTASGWITNMGLIYAEEGYPNNYRALDVGDGAGTGEKII